MYPDTRGPFTLVADPVEGVPPAYISDVNQRFKTPGMLLIGTIFGFFAFGGAFTVTVMEFFMERGSRLMGIPEYASGLGYWPETVSESVSNANSPTGKIFFTGCLIADILYFSSWYPFNLRNVYTGPETTLWGLMYSTTFRQYFPTLGLLMLVGVTTYPAAVAQQTVGGMICVMLHLAGAGMMFVGYMLSEFTCMEMFGFHHKEAITSNFLSIEGTERATRQTLIGCMGFCFALFLVFQVLLMLPPTIVCCADEWKMAGDWYELTDRATGHKTDYVVQIAHVNNTASGKKLAIKMGSYFTEVCAGIMLLLSHAAVYYFCEERHVDYGCSELEMVYDDSERYYLEAEDSECS